MTLQHGGFIIDTTKLNKKLGGAKLTINRATCSVEFSGTGPSTVGDGTGAYAGITGTLAITVTFASIAPKTANGCDLENPPSHDMYQSVTGVGSVSYK